MPDEPVRQVVVEYSGEKIPVALEFGERQGLSISVDPDGSVTARAPVKWRMENVLARIEHKRAWIARQRRYFKAYHPLPEIKRFVSGETHLYLGRQYRLRVRRAQDVDVKLVGRFFNICVPEPDEPRCVRTALDAWYLAHAKAIYRNQLEQCLESAPSFREVEPTFRIRRMSQRWGSCSKKGTITLSTELIKAPLDCIEYVILHELCHLRVHDHSPGFFRLLGSYMPDWRQRKTRLDAVVLR